MINVIRMTPVHHCIIRERHQHGRTYQPVCLDGDYVGPHVKSRTRAEAIAAEHTRKGGGDMATREVTIAEAVREIDLLTNERDAALLEVERLREDIEDLRAAVEATRADLDLTSAENARLRAQLADSDQRIAAAVESGYALGVKAATEANP